MIRMIKAVVVVAVLAVGAVFFYQNLPTLSSPISFSLDLAVRRELHWSCPLGWLMLGSAGGGFFLGAWLFLRLYWRKRKALKEARALTVTAPSAETAVQYGGGGDVEPPAEGRTDR